MYLGMLGHILDDTIMCKNKAEEELRNVLAMKATPAFIWDKFGSVCHLWGINPFDALKELTSGLSGGHVVVLGCSRRD